ncbi:hypothetical protein [Nostoc parmelioides]|nr:hypothetical protein [Nostoc parmelioides]
MKICWCNPDSFVAKGDRYGIDFLLKALSCNELERFMPFWWKFSFSLRI